MSITNEGDGTRGNDEGSGSDDIEALVRYPGDASPASRPVSERTFSDRGGIITARGTGDGVVIRLDGRVEREALKDAVTSFMISRREFLSGNEVAIEWVGAIPDQKIVDDIAQVLTDEFDISVTASRLWDAQRGFDSQRPGIDSEIDGLSGDVGSPSAHGRAGGFGGGFGSSAAGGQTGARKSSRPMSLAKGSSSVERIVERDSGAGREFSLFDGIEGIGDRGAGSSASPRVSAKPAAAAVRKTPAIDPSLWDDPDSRLISGTIRSGQKIETEHSLVVFGDVNSGAEIIAGGDIVVLGTLRGTAHAGAYDETGAGRVIFALNLHPTQLRIGTTISRGPSDNGQLAEVARVEDGVIVVEPYQAKLMANRRRI